MLMNVLLSVGVVVVMCVSYNVFYCPALISLLLGVYYIVAAHKSNVG